MPAYSVTAYTSEGRLVRQQIQAASPAAAREHLRALRLFPASVKERTGFFNNPKRLKLSRKELTTLFSHLELQISAGVIAVEAVTTLKDRLTSPRLRYILREVCDHLTSSKANLTNAFRMFPRSFPPDVISVINAGEQTASLDARFGELRSRLEFTASVQRDVKKALQYPAFVTLLGVGLITFIMGRLVPQFTKLLHELGAPLPPFTQRVIAVSDWFVVHWWHVLLCLIAVPVSYVLMRRIPRVAIRFDGAVLKLPLIGGIYKDLTAALFARTYRSLYMAGTPPFEALDLCVELVNNLALRASVRRVKRHLGDGDTLATALDRSGVLPAEACAIVASGEAGGRLEVALDKVAGYWAEEGRRKITSVTAWIGPLAIVVLAIGVGCVVIAMLLPLFNLINAVK